METRYQGQQNISIGCDDRWSLKCDSVDIVY